MPDWTSYNYLIVEAATQVPWRSRSLVAFDTQCRLNGTPKPAWISSSTLELEADGGTWAAASGAVGEGGAPEYILHGRQFIYTRNAGGVPVSTRLVNGTGGRTVPWGVLQEAVEVDESDVRTWTGTDGPNAGRTVGVSLENPRKAVSLTAIFLKGIAPPARGSIFPFRLADGTTGRMICLRVTHQWSNGGFYQVQVDGTQWDGNLVRVG